MAEHSAHLTSGGAADTDRPNVFEVLAQESLMSTVRPALRHAVRVFSERYPEHLSKLLQHYDEVFLLLDALVQSYYLKKYDGSFAENFYDLKRVPSSSPDEQLSTKHKFKSLACLILIPYVKQKLDNYFEELRYREASENSSPSAERNVSMKQRLVRLYVSIYPYVHSFWESLTLTYTVLYMFGKTQWHSPRMHLSGTQLRRIAPEDKFFGRATHKNIPWSDLSLKSRLFQLARLSFNTAAVCLSTGLSVGVFFLQFLDWWYASDSSAPSLTALPIPPPPKKEQLRDVSTSSCPLCLRLRTNSTALAVSGYVFCYPCIQDHVKKEKCCPVTGYPATSDHLVRIYEQDT